MKTHLLGRMFRFGLLACVFVAAGCDEVPTPTQADKSGPVNTAPTIASITPASGRSSGATVVTIVGQRFRSGATVAFGGVSAVISDVSATSITVTTQAHDPGVVDVVVTNRDGQTVTAAARFTFAPPPSISSVTPATGSTGGRTWVAVSGSGFMNGASVTIDGAPVTAYLNNTGTGLEFETPAHAPGTVDVVVRNPDGEVLTGAYTFALPETFDFNGNWYAYLGDGNDYPFTFTVENNALVSLTCYEGTPVPLAAPVPVSHGEINTSVNDIVIFSARIAASTQAVGTIDAGLCHSQDWGGWKDQPGQARRTAAVSRLPGRRK